MSSIGQRTPPMTPPSPSASLYAQSDEEEGGYDTIKHTRTTRGVKLLYSKSKVYIHPTPSAKDNIPGFIALIRQRGPAPTSRPATPTTTDKSDDASSLLLAWLPESALGNAYETYVKVDLSESSSPPKQSYLVPPPPVTIHHSSIGTFAFSVPISQIYSLLIRPPSIGWWFGSVVINTCAGDSFPALFFHDTECQSTILQRKKLVKDNFDPFSDGGGAFWGGDEVLRWLKQYVNVERATQDPNVYLIDPTEEDRQGLGLGAQSEALRKKLEKQARKPGPSIRDAGMDPITKALKEARWFALEKLAQVTTFTRRTVQAVAENRNVPPQVKRLMQNPDVVTLQDEFDSARVYLARWAMGIAEDSEREKRKIIWTSKEVMEMEDSALGEFEILDIEASLKDRTKSVTLAEWDGFFDHAGRLQITPDEVKDRIFHGGLNPDDGVRKQAWLFLLEFYEWDSSNDERHAVMASRRDEYIKLKGAWWERMAEGTGTLEEAEWWKDQKGRIEKDVHRTDRNIAIFQGEDVPHPDPDSPFAETGTNVHMEQMKDMLLTYNEYNKDLGYVQGMSDLLAPIYVVMQDDAVAFWAFVGFMKRMERNFLRDQSGMRLQLRTLDQILQLMDPKLYLHLQKAESTNFFFFFRMMLVWFKREFLWTDVLRLWESLWTDYYSSNFHVFIALSILEKHREVIMEHLQHFDEVLKYINELSNTIELSSTLIRAEALFIRFRRTVEAIDKKSNFPAPHLSLRPRPQCVPSESSAIVRPPHARLSNPRVQSSDSAVASSSASDVRAPPQRQEHLDAVEEQKEKQKIITPELRDLLSRNIPKLDKKQIKDHGGGII